jgi:DNA-binding HxlR family transcriptional regulator
METKNPARSGAKALELLAAPLNLLILRGLESGSRSAGDLRGEIGSPPQSTMRIYLRSLREVGAIGAGRKEGFQGTVEYSLTQEGRDLLDVAGTLGTWLSSSPRGPIELGTPTAKNAIRALVDGWSSNIVRAVSAQSIPLTELSRLIPKVSYPTLERRLTALRLVGLVEAHKEDGRSTPYQSTDWLRRAVAVLTSASEWERDHMADTTPPIGRLDVEAAFLLAVPLMELPADLSGKVRLAVEIQRGASPVFAGVLVCVEDGRVTSCTPGPDGEAEAWVSGAPRSWLRRINRGEADHIEIGGDTQAAQAILRALERTAARPGGFG